MGILNCNRFYFFLFILFGQGLLLSSGYISESAANAAESEVYQPSIQSEAQYSEALVFYHRKQNSNAMKVLNELVAQEPKYLEALELKVLLYKSQKNEKKVVETYQTLLQKAPEGKQGPYYFELGLIYQKKKQIKESYHAFSESAKQGFNIAASHLFLGTMDSQAGKLYSAERHFRKVISDGGGDLKLVARFQLGMVLMRVGNSSSGLTEIIRAKEMIAENPDSVMGSQLKEPIDKLLGSLNKSTWYGSVNLSTLVDTNISEVPDTTTTNAAVSGKETVKFTLVGGAGHMTAPYKDLQVVSGYRLSVNKNMNTRTQSYQYLNHLPSVYLNYKPMEPLNGGLKVGAIYSSQYIDPVFRRLSLTGDFGVFGKWQMNSRYQLGVGANYKPSRYFRTWSSGGRNLSLDLGLKVTTASRFLNFEFGFTPERNHTHLKTSRYDALEGKIKNNILLSDRWSVYPEVSLKRSKYIEVSPRRVDRLWKGKLNSVHRFSNAWSANAELTFEKNFSTQRLSYQYTRWIYGFGLTKGF